MGLLRIGVQLFCLAAQNLAGIVAKHADQGRIAHDYFPLYIGEHHGIRNISEDRLEKCFLTIELRYGIGVFGGSGLGPGKAFFHFLQLVNELGLGLSKALSTEGGHCGHSLSSPFTNTE